MISIFSKFKIVKSALWILLDCSFAKIYCNHKDDKKRVTDALAAVGLPSNIKVNTHIFRNNTPFLNKLIRSSHTFIGIEIVLSDLRLGQ